MNNAKKIIVIGLCCAVVLVGSAAGAKFVYKSFLQSNTQETTMREETTQSTEKPTETTAKPTEKPTEVTTADTVKATEAPTEATTQAPATSKIEVTPPTEPYEDVSKAIDKSSLKGYQAKYDGLYCAPRETIPVDKKTVYLTFDDGPSVNTKTVLDELDKNGVKATFFVVSGGKNEEMLKENLIEIVKRGHTIGIHTHTHNYKSIYASVDTFLEDLDKVNRYVYEITGIRPEVYRFPGGSKNNFNKNVANDILNEMERRGFVSFDWNSSLQDAEGKKFTAHQLAENAISTYSDRKRVIVLAHDGSGQKTTPHSITEIVEYSKSKGYVFGTLDNTCGQLLHYKRH